MTHTDRVVLVVLSVAAMFLMLLRLLAFSSGAGNLVQIELGGRVLRRIPVLAPSGTRRIAVSLPRGRAMVSLERGGVRILPMARSLCPRGICSHSGLIRRPGETLVCAPNRLVVRILGGEARVDAVTR